MITPLVIIMCANPKTIREIMIAAEELKMIDSGEYVFFNVEIFGSLTRSEDLKPWYDPTDVKVRNDKAKKAFEAVLTITTKKPEDKEYENFSKQARRLKINLQLLSLRLTQNYQISHRSNFSQKKNTIINSARTSKSVSLLRHFTTPFCCLRVHSTRASKRRTVKHELRHWMEPDSPSSCETQAFAGLPEMSQLILTVTDCQIIPYLTWIPTQSDWRLSQTTTIIVDWHSSRASQFTGPVDERRRLQIVPFADSTIHSAPRIQRGNSQFCRWCWR